MSCAGAIAATDEVADAVLDWRDTNEQARAGGAERGYYGVLDFPYEIRNGPLQTLGELGLFFRLSTIVFMGKSLVAAGGQNPIEPARLGAAILVGPHTWNFEEIIRSMLEAGGLEVVANTEQLAAAVAKDLENPSRAQSRAQAALKYAEAESAVLERFIDRISPLLDAAEDNAHARA